MLTNELIGRVFTVQAQLIVVAPEGATAQALMEAGAAAMQDALIAAASPVALQVEKESGQFVFQES